MNRLAGLFLIMCLSFASFAKDFPTKPNPPRLVNDFVGILNEQEKASLESKLLAYSDSTSTQIAIIIENSVEGEDDFDYSRRLAENWQIGTKGKNNGLLIYVAIGDRKIRIQNGYGMEATITDALSKRIIEEYIKPNFKQKRYFAGLDEATNIIMRAASGEYINDSPRGRKGKVPSPIKIILIVIMVILFLIFSNKGGGGRRGGFFGPTAFMGTFGSGGFRGGGGGGGGGFGGFGGGSFGGGGAGGSW